ncbi:MAG: Lrp/AsnC family transcriptional regulator [Promethearchaeota archaeon]|nr:MAG: Lrp/AsnC family transcriptional regulator [Candidatus Lokiarchaeota archaeon]
MKKDVLDDIDKEIIKILQDDASKSYREIQGKLNISIGTIHNRISKLKKNGIIKGYTLKIDNSKLGYKLTFLIRIQIDGKHTSEILQEISKKPEVCSVFHTTGEQSAALICRFKESEDVHKFIRELNEREFVTRTNSNMVLKEYKNNSYVEI